MKPLTEHERYEQRVMAGILPLPRRKLAEGWKKTSEGYELKTDKGLAKVYKRGTRWFVSLGKQEAELGQRASFDHAEGELKKMLREDL